MNQIFNLSGKNAIVTGANTGLGQAMALALAASGASVVLVGRSRPDETADRIKSSGGDCAVVMADLSSLNDIPRIVEESSGKMGPIDILVNNAGIIRREVAVDFSEDDWDDVLNTNLKVPFFLAQAVARTMIDQDRAGKIINVASLLSFQGGLRVASYTSSKSGLAGLTRLLANEWAGKNINVNAIVPGYFATNNTQALRDDANRNKEILARIPAGRWGEPSDIAGAAIFLASAASDYVHGSMIPVDGGWLAR